MFDETCYVRWLRERAICGVLAGVGIPHILEGAKAYHVREELELAIHFSAGALEFYSVSEGVPRLGIFVLGASAICAKSI